MVDIACEKKYLKINIMINYPFMVQKNISSYGN